jgi:hypothetical protein
MFIAANSEERIRRRQKQSGFVSVCALNQRHGRSINITRLTALVRTPLACKRARRTRAYLAGNERAGGARTWRAKSARDARVPGVQRARGTRAYLACNERAGGARTNRLSGGFN